MEFRVEGEESESELGSMITVGSEEEWGAVKEGEGASLKEWERRWLQGPSLWSGSEENRSDGEAVLVHNSQVEVTGSMVSDGVYLEQAGWLQGLEY
ncbi:hypothetical protein SKAU_G00239790 [Synaphobranchus kaupii]|uniref:Uncharacterized protein n=1 Tax=Synaphobranchus kaupii TaxID=118154 RepID=A0A9Q1F7F6_SYNKA|nr:hypothetical protein SKAU_G00239790 [Synaphobranchus kaupii]